jgi:hypothetical protein
LAVSSGQLSWHKVIMSDRTTILPRSEAKSKRNPVELTSTASRSAAGAAMLIGSPIEAPGAGTPPLDEHAARTTRAAKTHTARRKHDALFTGSAFHSADFGEKGRITTTTFPWVTHSPRNIGIEPVCPEVSECHARGECLDRQRELSCCCNFDDGLRRAAKRRTA